MGRDQARNEHRPDQHAPRCRDLWHDRLKLLKIDALVKTRFRRILFSMASAFPYVDDYAAAWAALHSAA